MAPVEQDRVLGHHARQMLGGKLVFPAAPTKLRTSRTSINI